MHVLLFRIVELLIVAIVVDVFARRLITTFGGVVFSVVVQGLTMPFLLRLLCYRPTSSLAPEMIKVPEEVERA